MPDITDIAYRIETHMRQMKLVQMRHAQNMGELLGYLDALTASMQGDPATIADVRNRLERYKQNTIEDIQEIAEAANNNADDFLEYNNYMKNAFLKLGTDEG